MNEAAYFGLQTDLRVRNLRKLPLTAHFRDDYVHAVCSTAMKHGPNLLTLKKKKKDQGF